MKVEKVVAGTSRICLEFLIDSNLAEIVGE
jgi:hypothetical protein